MLVVEGVDTDDGTPPPDIKPCVERGGVGGAGGKARR